MERDREGGIQEEFAERVGVEYTVAPLTQKDNICRPHLTCTNTHPHVVHTGRKYSSTAQVGTLSLKKKKDAVHTDTSTLGSTVA